MNKYEFQRQYSRQDSRPSVATAAGAVLTFALLLVGAAPLHAQGLFGPPPSSCQPGQPCYQGAPQRQASVDPAWAAVVKVETKTAEPGTISDWGSGTLFHAFDDDGTGLIVTNWHVVKDRASETSVDVHFVQVNVAAHAKVLEANEAWDVAVLWTRIPPGVRPVPVRETVVELGETLTAAGYAHAQDQLLIDNGRPSTYLKTPETSNEPYTLEVTTASHRTMGAYQGMSGGPMIDAQGRLACVLWGSDQVRGQPDKFIGSCSARLCPILDRWRRRVRGGKPGDDGTRLTTPTKPGYVPPQPTTTAPVVPVTPPSVQPAVDLGPLRDRLQEIDANLKALLAREFPKVDLSRVEADLKALKAKPDVTGSMVSALADQTDIVGRHEVVIQELNTSVKAIVPKIIAALPKVGAVVAASNPASAWLAPVLASLGGAGGMAVAWQFIKRRIDAKAAAATPSLTQANDFVANLRKMIAIEFGKLNLSGSLSTTAQGPAPPLVVKPDAPPTFVPVQVNDPGHAALVKALETLGQQDPQAAALVRKAYSFRDQLLNQSQS